MAPVVITAAVVCTALLYEVLAVETNLSADVHEHTELKGNVTSADVGPRIFNGHVAAENQFPFMVLLMAKLPSTMGFCSASYLKPKWVLTSAHCVFHDTMYKPENVFAFSGYPNMETIVGHNKTGKRPKKIQERKAKSLHIHPDYDDVFYSTYDIALVELEEEFDKSVGFVDLAGDASKNLEDCQIIGWGRTESGPIDGKLRYTNGLTLKSLESGCWLNDSELTAMCSKMDKTGAMPGDSGGPAICNGLVYGIGSFIKYYGGTPEGYYANVPLLKDWVTTTLESSISTTIKPNAFLVVLIGVILIVTAQ